MPWLSTVIGIVVDVGLVAGLSVVLAAYGVLLPQIEGRVLWCLYLAFGVGLIFLLLRDGTYWGLFPRGEGWWTANRASAGAVYLIAFTLPSLISAYRWHTGGRQAAMERRDRLRRENNQA